MEPSVGLPWGIGKVVMSLEPFRTGAIFSIAAANAAQAVVVKVVAIVLTKQTMMLHVVLSVTSKSNRSLFELLLCRPAEMQILFEFEVEIAARLVS